MNRGTDEHSLTRLFVGRPTLALVACALVALAGALAFATLVQQNFPNIDFPVVAIRASYPGASPTEIRDAIVRPIEDSVAGAPDLDHLTSTIQQGSASIVAVFTLDSNQTSDLVQVQRRLQAVLASLPSDLTAPTVATFDPGEATVASLLAVSQSLDPSALSAIVQDRIVPELEQVSGVANVQVGGAVTPALEVRVDPNKLAAAGLTLGDVVTAISRNNVRAPGGIVYSPNRETTLDIRGDLSTVASVAGLPLGPSAGTGGAKLSGPSGASRVQGPATAGAATTGGTAATSAASNIATGLGAFAASSNAAPATGPLNLFSVAPRTLTISDVATVVDGAEPQRSYAYVDGLPALTLDVQKASGASEITASDAVLAALPRLRKEYPAIDFRVLRVQADYTAQQLDSAFLSLGEGVLFTAIVLLFFLRSWRNALVVAIAIPTSLAVTLALMKAMNFTVDTISLLAMTLTIGILVDDSIVVLENSERHYEDGEPPQTAAILGREQIGSAALVITLVDVVVFAPISFLPGTVGKFMAEFGLVVVAATLTSLAVSFTITPALAGNWSLRSTWRPPALVDRFTAGFEGVRSWYLERVLPWALRHRIALVSASAVAVVGSLALVPLGAIGFAFIPPLDRGEIFVRVDFPAGTPLTATDAAIHAISLAIAKEPDVASDEATAGQFHSGFGGGIALGSSGQVHVFLNDDRKRSTAQWAAIFTRRLGKEFPAARIVAVPATGVGGGNAQPIDLVITSTEDDNPLPWVAKIQAALAATPGALNVNSSLAKSVPQLEVRFDRARARALNVDIATAANAVRASFGGALAAQFSTTLGTKYVQVTFPQSAQTSLAAIDAIPIRSNGGKLLHVGDIVSFAYQAVSPVINRVNRQTVVQLGANVASGFAPSRVQAGFAKRLAALHLPPTVQVVPNAGGQQQNLSQTVEGLGLALLLAFALVYLLMVALYDSYRLPFIIMFAVPVASVGALGSLALTHQTLNLFSLIGTVMLVGLVSKNGILLVDGANHRLRAGLDRLTAIRESARERFRPIVMTTASMVAGMSPIALALDPGAAVRRSLGIVVIGGLISSLLLTLLLVPIAFTWFAPRYPGKPPRTPKAEDLPLAPVEVSG
ncbi:MAG: efflux RND transporter permease subunit [Vulcanimicrobiaceae bacterium]